MKTYSEFFTDRNGTEEVTAELRCFLPDVPPRAHYAGRTPAVIVIPGGGYHALTEIEKEPIVYPFLAAGIPSFLLLYYVHDDPEKPTVFPTAQKEGFQAVRYVRDHAEEFGIDPHNISVLGFSAGGHLAASLGTFWNKPFMREFLPADRDPADSRPDKMILSYPVVSCVTEHIHAGTFKHLIGKEKFADKDFAATFSPDENIDEDTPPAFLWATSEDTVVPVEGLMRFAYRMALFNKHFELHVWPHGPHALGTGNQATKNLAYEERHPCADWVESAVRFAYDADLAGDARLPQ